MDLQSRTAFPVDLSLPRDNTGIWPKAGDYVFDKPNLRALDASGV